MENLQTFPEELERVEIRPVFPNIQPINVPENLDEVATQAALVEQQHTGNPMEEQTYQSTYNIQTIGMDEVRRSISEKEKGVAVSVAEDFVRQAKEPSMADAAQYYQEVLDFHNGPRKTAMEEAVVEIITPKNAPQYYNQYNMNEATKNMAARNILYDTLFESHQNASFWDKVLTFARDVIPFVNSRSVAKSVAESLGRNTKWTESINPTSIVEEFRAAYLNASPEKRKDLVQALAHGLDKYSRFFGDKNANQMYVNLQKVLQGTASEFTETTLFDTIGLPVATVGTLIFRGLGMATQLGKPAIVAKSVGNADLAANMMAKDALRGTKVSGMTPDEIAREAASMNIAPLEVAFNELKVGQQLQEKLRLFSATLRTNVSDVLKPRGVTAEEMSAADDIVSEMYSAARNKAIYEYTPESYENGLFKGVVKWQSPDGVPFQSKAMAEGFGVDANKIGQAVEIRPVSSVEDEAARMADEGGMLYRPAGRRKKGVNTDDVQPGTSGLKPPEQWIFVERVQEPIPLDAIGMFSRSDVEGRNFFNANTPFFSASKQIVDERGVGMAANAKIRRDLESAYKESVKGLSGSERAQVTNVLAEGDAFSNNKGAFGHVFSHDELIAKGLSEKGIEAYYKQRLLRDNMWLMRNKQMVEEFHADGIKEMAFEGNNFVKPMNRPVKPLESGAVKSLIGNGKMGKVLDTRNGRVSQLNSDEVDEIYEAGGQVVRLYKPEGIGNRKFTHIVLDNNEARISDIRMALPYRPGEFARVYTDEYFITLRRPMMDEFDNVGHTTETFRTAKNAKEAEEFVRSYNQALRIAVNKEYDAFIGRAGKLAEIERLIGKYTNPQAFLDEVETRGLKADDVFDFHYNRETHSYLADTVDEAITNGRLFYSHKGEKLLATDPTRSNTLGVTDSLGVELANISRYITSNDIRVTAIERWMNTFGDGIANRTFNKWMDFDKGELSADLIKKSLLNNGSDLAKLEGDELLKFAEQTRKYIRQQLNIRTTNQKLNEARFRKAVEWLEGKSGLSGKFLDWFGPALRKSDVADFIRKVNFHVTLGMGNPVQLIVQANGMFIAAAVHPIHGLSAAKSAVPLRMALMSDNPNVWKTMATVDNLTSLGLKNVDEFVDMVKAVRKSGLLDDIKSTALYNVEDGALDLYKSYGKSAFKESSPFFFNRGEEFSRLVSWEVSRREWKAQHPGKDWRTDDALKEILVRQREFNLGMQAHNTAAWQKGWAGIPMQFLQYNIKLATSLLHTAGQLGKDINKSGWKALYNFENGNYRGFNPAQASRLLASQLVLYGAAGNGLRMVVNEMWGDADNTMSEEQKMYISEGLMGGLFYTVTKELDENGEGAKLALGKRLGSFEWYQQMWDKIVEDKTDVTDFLFGVTKSTGVRFLDVFKGLGRVFYYGEDAVTPELIMSELGKAPEVVASFSNALRAYTYMQNEGIVTSKYGTPIARINAKENLAAFLGIQSVQVSEYYESVKDVKRLERDLAELAVHIRQLQLREIDAVIKGDDKLASDIEKLRWAMMPRDLGHREIVNRILREKLWPGDTQSDKIRRQFEGLLNQEQEKFRVLDKGQ